MSEYNLIHVEHVGEVVVIGFVKPILRSGLDDNENELLKDLRRVFESGSITKAVVSFDAVEYCSSETISCLIMVANTLVANGGGLHLCLVPDCVREKLQRLNLEHAVFPVYECLAEAIAFFDESSGN